MHSDIPEDWFVIVADVVGSTKGIEEGRYKSVNTVGATVIVSVLNVDRSVSIPYVFGGDGATLAVPPHFVEKCKKSLLAVKRLAMKSFGIELRAGLIPVADLMEQGVTLRVANFVEKNHVYQSIFSGQGWDVAESWVKSPEKRDQYEIEDDGHSEIEADLSGLECRWEAIPSFKDHKLSIIIQSREVDPDKIHSIYENIYSKIQEIYGDVHEHHPIRQDGMNLSIRPSLLMYEAKPRCDGSLLLAVFYIAKTIVVNLIGRYLFRMKVDTESVRWSEYQSDLIENTDYKKFDGMLKMIVDGTKQQKLALEAYLAQLRENKSIVYGIHESRAALLTCMVFSYNKTHSHFVDGSDGGYALAAKMLKAQLKEQ